jgi:DNA-binding winged helix-turn-helix (wHTH) protein
MGAGAETPIGWRIADLVFRADGTLWRNDQLIHLTPLQRRMLQAFCSHAGQLVRREQLVEEVWKRQDVSEQSLARAIHSLRRVLDAIGIGGDRIVTVYGGGYTFSIGVSALSSDPWGQPKPAMTPQSERSYAPNPLAVEHRQEGLMLLRLNHPDLVAPALEHLQRCLELDHQEEEARVELGWLLLQQAVWGLEPASNCARLISELAATADAAGNRPEGLQQLRAESLSLLEWKPLQAELLYRSHQTVAMGRGQALQSWCRHLLATGRPHQALELLAPHLHRQLPFGWLLASMARLHMHDADGALAALQHLLTIRPLQSATNLSVAVLLSHLGETATALALLDTAAASPGALLLGHRIPPVRAFVLATAGQPGAARRILAGVNLQEGTLPQPCLWALAALACDHPLAGDLWKYSVQQKCYGAPFLLHSPLLSRFAGHPVVEEFKVAMGSTFLALAADELLVG